MNPLSFTQRVVMVLTSAPLPLLIKVSGNILQCALGLCLLINLREGDHNYLPSCLADSSGGVSSCRSQARPRGYQALVCWVRCLVSLLPPFILQSYSSSFLFICLVHRLMNKCLFIIISSSSCYFLFLFCITLWNLLYRLFSYIY